MLAMHISTMSTSVGAPTLESLRPSTFRPDDGQSDIGADTPVPIPTYGLLSVENR